MALRFLRDGTFTGSVSADSYISTTDAGININGITLSRVAANSAIRVGDGLETLGLLRSYANLIVATTGNFGGNVTVGSGLGAVATDGVLQINGGSGSGGEAYLNLTRGGSSGFILNHTATAIQVRATANIPMFFYTNDTLSLKINANNTISLPTYGAGYLKTDGSGNVTADSSAPGTGVFLPLAGGTMDSGATIDMSGTLTMDSANIDIKSSLGVVGTITSSSNSLTLNARYTGDMIFQSGGAEKMRIANGGNVGIGTTFPDSLLHVSADVTGANTGTITIEGRPTGFLGDDIATIDFHNNGSKRADIRMERGNAADDSQLVFSTSDTGTLNDALIINEIGNVGIGTTSPNVLGFLETGLNIAAGSSSSTTLQQAGLVISGSSDSDDADDFGYLSFTNYQSTLSSDRVAEIRINKGGSNVNTGKFNFYTANGTALNESMVLGETGLLKLSQYGAGTLVSDASGNITVSSGGGAGGPYLPLAGGTMTGNNGVTFPDDFYLYVGTSNDLRIYHNSTNGSNIWNTVGHLTIQNTADNQDINFKNDNGAGGNATYFYLDGSLTNGTTTLGATRFPDNSKIFMGTGGDLVFNHDGTNSFINNLTGDLTIENAGDDLILKSADDFIVYVKSQEIAIQADSDGKVGLRYNNVEKFATTGAGVTVTGQLTVTNGIEMTAGNFNAGDGERIRLGNSADFQIYHDGSNSYIDNNTGNLTIDSGVHLLARTATGESLANFYANGANELFYDNSKKLSTGAVGVGTATTAGGTLVDGWITTTQANAIDNTTIATTAYVNNKIALIPAGLLFEGTWDARTVAEGGTGNPPSASPANGQFWIVSVNGSTNLSGITDWKVGDWAIYVVAGAGTDGWQKVDNSSVLDGSGTGQTLPLWSGSGTSNTLTDSRFTQTSTRNQILGPGNAASDYSLRVANAANTEQLYIQGTGEVVVSQNYFYVAASQGMYSNGLARFRGGITNDQTTLNLGGNGYSSNLQLTSGGASGSARFYGSTETTGNVVTGPNITAIGNTGNSTLTLQANTGNWTFTNVQASRNLEISDSDGTGTVMTINTSGDVGIGTTGPQALLDVRKDIATIYDPLQDLGQRSGTATIHITNQDTTVGSFGQIMYDSDGSNQGIARIVFVDSGTASVDTAFVNEHNNTKAERMRITSAGNVGIGTDSPNDILHVSKAAAATRLRVGNNGAYDASIYFNTSTDWSIGTDTSNSNSLTFGNSSAIGTGTKMVIETNGNVGIGTTNPGQKLHINDGSTVTTTDANNMLLLTRDNHSYIMFSCPDEKDSGLHFHNTTDNTFVGRIAYSHESAGDHMLFTVNNSTRIDINYNGDVRFNSYGAGTLITDSSGNITVSSGGGAGGPYLPLSAGSGFPLTGHLFIDTPAGASQSGYALKLNKTNSSSQVQVGAEIFATPWASNTNGGTIIFKNADTATNLQETLRISANGSVGINSTSSSYKLDVGGNARFQDSVYIDTSTGAGGLYVTRLGSPVESLKIYTSDSTSVFETFQDENTGVYGSMAFILDNGAPDPVYDFKYGSIVRLRIEGGTGDVILGDALLSNQENTDVDTGTETVASVAIATYTAAFFDFVIKKGTNVRSGTVYACHDGTNVEFTETSTNDLGDTSDVTLSVDISGGNMRLRATTTSDDWSVKSLIRAI